jgi:hypothetical protein
MLLKQKKAILFNISLVIITALVLGTALFTLSPRYLSVSPIGLKQFELIEIYQEGEGALFYADQSAKYAAHDSIYSLAESGGFYNAPKCGKFSGYPIWQSDQAAIADCFPDYKNNFGEYLVSNLNKYFLTNENLKQIAGNLDYELSLGMSRDNLNIVGISMNYFFLPYIDKQEHLSKLTQQEKDCLAKPKHISIFERGGFKECGFCPNHPDCLNQYSAAYCSQDYKNYVDENYCNIDPCNYSSYWRNNKCVLKTAKYSVKPNFNIDVPYDLDAYERIRQGAVNLLNACGDKSTSALKGCIENTISGFGGQTWKIGYFDDRTFAFELDSGTMIPLYDDRVVYRFAIYFPTAPIAPTPTVPTPTPTTPVIV